MGDNDLELTSPDSSAELDDKVTDATSDDTPGPDSSAEASSDDKFDLLSVVRDAVTPDDADDSGSSTEDSGNSDDADSDDADSDAENGDETDAGPDEENFSDVPFHNHPRFKQLITQRNQYREGAVEYAKVQSFLEETGVSAEEAASALQIQGLLKTDPQEAWKQLQPVVQQLVRDIGLVLPDDLRQQVAEGKLSKEAAAEISRLRSQNATSQKQAEHQKQRDEQTARQQSAKAVTDAVANWELEQRKDPDFEAKAEDLMREVVWLQSKEGKPNSPDKAKDQLERAMKTVNEKIAARTKPKPSVQTLTGGRTASATEGAAPKSTLEIVQAASASG